MTMHDSFDISIEGLQESFDFEKVARQANGAVWYRQKKAILIATVVMDEEASSEPFLPLTVQYIEKSYAAGKIPGGFVKREMKPSEFEMLTARIVDRSIRPLFPEDFRYPVTITVLVVSSDPTVDLQIAALHAASSALYVSNLPIDKMVAGVRVANIDGEIIHNPPFDTMHKSTLDLLVVGQKEGVSMIEMKSASSECSDVQESEPVVSALDAVTSPSLLLLDSQSANEVDEKRLISLIRSAQNAIAYMCLEYEKLFEPAIKEPIDISHGNLQEIDSIVTFIEENFQDSLYGALTTKSKLQRQGSLKKLKEEILHSLRHYGKEVDGQEVGQALEICKRNTVREMILHEHKRVDGRGLKEIRPITIETNVLPSVHGSCLFRRGETQVLATVTLGDKKDAQMFELLTDKGSKSERFMVHYNFPGFSVGESKPIAAPSRRELGHGNLAKRAIEPVLDRRHEGTIRLVAEVLESNGSSSMATVCAGALALRSADVGMSDLVAGIAMGVVRDDTAFAIISDITGIEDQCGDMDFKVAGTKNGVTAMQMDIKVSGVGIDLLEHALLQAKEGRTKILEIMEETAKHMQRSEALPQSVQFQIDPGKIGEIIGKAGATIREIIERFEVAIDLDRKEGKVKVTGQDSHNIEAAREHIESIALKEPSTKIQYEQGKTYKGKIKRIVDFGAFVEMPEGESALLHISKTGVDRAHFKEVFREGDVIEVVVVDQKGSKIELAVPSFLTQQG